VAEGGGDAGGALCAAPSMTLTLEELLPSASSLEGGALSAAAMAFLAQPEARMEAALEEATLLWMPSGGRLGPAVSWEPPALLPAAVSAGASAAAAAAAAEPAPLAAAPSWIPGGVVGPPTTSLPTLEGMLLQHTCPEQSAAALAQMFERDAAALADTPAALAALIASLSAPTGLSPAPSAETATRLFGGLSRSNSVREVSGALCAAPSFGAASSFGSIFGAASSEGAPPPPPDAAATARARVAAMDRLVAAERAPPEDAAQCYALLQAELGLGEQQLCDLERLQNGKGALDAEDCLLVSGLLRTCSLRDDAWRT
jgi:hypothetical protein